MRGGRESISLNVTFRKCIVPGELIFTEENWNLKLTLTKTFLCNILWYENELIIVSHLILKKCLNA